MRKRNPVVQPRKELADLLVEYLAQLSVDFIFGIPGGAIEPLYNALARSARQGGPRAVVARHETGAAFMADGYYRQTGKLGVCCSTTGPGATNLITGVASAYENHIPLLAITAQTSLSHFGKKPFQDSSCVGIDTVGMFKHCTHYSTLVSHADQLERKLITAIMTAFQSQGPVHLSIPRDVLRSPALPDAPHYDLPNLIRRPALFDIAATEALVQQLALARKSAIVVGNGLGSAISDILALAEWLNAALITTPHGKGFINPAHPLYRGIIGFAGHASARTALIDPEVDTILAIGTNLGEWASNGWDSEALLNKRLVHVDSSEDHLSHSPMAKLHVRGYPEIVIAQVLARLQHQFPRSEAITQLSTADTPPGFEVINPEKCLQASIPIKPQWLMSRLTELFPPDTCFLADTGNSQAWSIHYLHSPIHEHPSTPYGGSYRATMEFASMGWAISAAIGTSLGKPSHPVVCITGDGSLLMSSHELSVAVQEHLPVIFIILNDSSLGMVKHGQMLAKAEPVAFELPTIDFCAYAKTMGATGFAINTPDDLLNLDIPAICRASGPTLLDVRIDPEEIPPIIARLQVLRANP